MKVSVITVCFNSAETIENAIHSVLSQDYPEIEFIIIDGKSTDSTADIISKYKGKISAFISEKDNGIYDALNKGIKIATGEVIGILHSDDFYAGNDVISIVAKKFESSETEAVYSDLQYVSKQNPSHVLRHWHAGHYSENLFASGWMPPHPTFYARKALFNRYGFYNTNFHFAADYELMLRFIHKHRIKLDYIPAVTTKMRVGGKGNVSLKNRFLANAEDKKAWLINGLKAPPFIRIKKPLSKLRQFI